eukprot:6193220-Pleurochrysis_carterae.AAC.2
MKFTYAHHTETWLDREKVLQVEGVWQKLENTLGKPALQACTRPSRADLHVETMASQQQSMHARAFRLQDAVCSAPDGRLSARVAACASLSGGVPSRVIVGHTGRRQAKGIQHLQDNGHSPR